MPFLTFGLPMCVAISLAIVTAVGFTGFAVLEDGGTIRAAWDWFAVATSVMLIVALFVIAKQYGHIVATTL